MVYEVGLSQLSQRDEDLIGLGFWAVLEKLNNLERDVRVLKQREKRIMADLSGISAEVENNTSVVESARVLIQDIANQLEQAGTDPVALQALTDTLRSNDENLAAAVAANTPAAEPPPVEG